MSGEHRPESDGVEPGLHLSLPLESAVPSGKIAEKGLGLIFIKLNDSFGKEQSTKWFRLIRAVPGRMGTFMVGAVIHELLDASLANMLGNVGKHHFESARDTLSEVPREKWQKRKREKIITAEGALRDAYQFHDGEVTARGEVALSTRAGKINAHRRAAEAAAYIASIDRQLGSDPENVAKWADNMRKHFDSYASLSCEAAENGITLSKFGRAVGVVGGVLVTGASGGLAGILLGATGGMSLIAGTTQRIGEHEAVLSGIAAERQHLQEFYENLTKP